jgi:hypothetical protein
VVELTNAPKACGPGDLVNRQTIVIEQVASEAYSARVGDLNRRPTQMFLEQAA